MEFKTFEGAEKAINTMHQFAIGDRKLVVREENARDRYRLAHMDVDGPSSSGGGASGDSHSKTSLASLDSLNSPSRKQLFPVINRHTLEKLGIEPPITDAVYVSNVSLAVTIRVPNYSLLFVCLVVGL